MYIRQKHATLHKFFLILTKKLPKDAATVVFVWKVAQGSSFKKDSQFNSHF